MPDQQFEIINADVLVFTDNWESFALKKFGKEGVKAHALLSDWPYNLKSILARFGSSSAVAPKKQKDGSFSRQAAGFMGQRWDTDFAYQKETWVTLQQMLHPGAFTAGFSHARQFDLLLSAQREAGMLINPAFFMSGQFYEMNPVTAWIYGSGKPTGTSVSTFLDDPTDKWTGYQYGSPFKPAWEPIVWSQKPYLPKERIVDQINRTGAGAVNIEAGKQLKSNQKFPDTFLPVHHPECRYLGMITIKNSSGSVSEDLDTNSHVNTYEGKSHTTGYDQSEYVEAPNYECHPDCEFKDWDKERLAYFYQVDWNFEVIEQLLVKSPVFYTGKASKAERNAFLDHLPNLIRQRANTGGYAATDPKWMNTIAKNNHPTLKPIKLTYYLASLLLPPVEYYPRIIVVPCSGVGSEVIGCLLAGWDYVIGIEIKSNYAELSQHRIAGWWNLIRYGNLDVDNIIATAFADGSFVAEKQAGQLGFL